jgi:GTP-binding protein HflX
MKSTTHESTTKPLRAILVALVTKKQSAEKTTEYLDELAFLITTAGIESVGRYTQRLDRPDPKTFIGKGKLEEIKAQVDAEGVEIVCFDDDLSPSQLKNLEKELKCRIYDRSLLILEIFLLRAQTTQARTQVELARYQYLLPRLTRMWTHLERQRGGTGTRGGSGEKEIETDKRVIKDKITLLKEKLKIIEKQASTRRKSRTDVVRVALVGYTNVGKSTLMNLLSKSDVFAENKLFATVDSTVRKVVLDTIPFLLSDTVGFIRKLPTSLIESFKSTLDEVREADILLHVVDLSHPSFEEHIQVVNATLAEIGAADKPTLLVFNKLDLFHKVYLDNPEKPFLEDVGRNYMVNEVTKVVFISAAKKEKIDELRAAMMDLVKLRYYEIFPNYLPQ